jgi:hypothetical protein
MPIVAMPDGVQVQFPDDMPKEQIRSLILQKFPDAARASGEEPADHGLSERQKLSPVGKAISPISSYPETYQRMNRESRDLVSSGVDQLTKGFGNAKEASLDGLGDAAIGAGKVAIGGMGYLASPINAAYRSIVGQPVEDVTGIPREYTEFAAQLATPGIGLPGAVRQQAPNMPRPSVAPAAPETNGIAAAADRVSQVAPEQVNVPRAFASDSMPVQRTAQSIRNLPVIGDAIPRATGEMADQLAGARNAIASSYGEGSGPNVASRIGRNLDTAATQEGTAAREATAQGDAAVLADWERAQARTLESIQGRETSALEATRRAVGDMSPQDMGQVLNARLRAGEAEARANKERLYGIAGNSDGAIYAGEVGRVRDHVARGLDEAGVVVDDTLTPAASRMMAELERLAGANSGGGTRTMPSAGPQSAPAPRAPRAPDGPQAQSLAEFLASKGGLGPDAELEAIGAHNHTVNVPGAGRRKLTRQGGLPLDYAREAAEEAGYLQGTHKGTSTTRDLLDALDAEMRGQKRYAQGFEGHVGKREAVKRSEREQYEWEAYNRGFEDDLAAAGHGRLPPEVKQRAIDLMKNEKLDADTAAKQAFQRLEQEDKAIAGAPNIERPPVSVQELEQARKRLVFFRSAASNDADRRAASNVMSQFEDWQSKAFENALFAGSDEALNAFRAARAANTQWRQRFFNDENEAGKFVERIVTGEITPQETANYLVGAGKVGAKGASSRLLTRIVEATGGDQEAMQAIRGGVWNRLSQSTEGVTAKNGAKVADDIGEFLNGSGRDLAQRLFTPEQQGIMRTYADTLRRGGEAREMLTQVAKNTKPSASSVNMGPMEELAQAVLGKGGKTDEALFSAIDSYAKSGGRGDLKTLADLVKVIPEKDKGDLAGALIRKLGQSGDSFSLDMFASQWTGKNGYTPQAKAILFGNAGPHRQALDDIAMISQRYKDIGRRFGNPSGTAQNVSLLGTAAWVVGSPYTAIPAILGGAVAARMLAAPAGASSISKWGRVMEAVKQAPSPQRIAALQIASRNLVNTSTAFGGKVSPPDFMRQLQGAVPAGAQNEQQ